MPQLESFHVEDVVERVKFLYNNPGRGIGINTCYPKLDYVTGGLKPAELWVLAARPSVGKTLVALNIMYNLAVQTHIDGAIPYVYLFSQEMSQEQILWRMAAMVSGVPTKAVENGNYWWGGVRYETTKEQYQEFGKAIRHIAGLPIRVCDMPITTDEMKEMVEGGIKADEPPVLVISDYLQLHSDVVNRNASETDRLTRISKNLKGIANTYKIPVIAVSQLSRAVEVRGGDFVPLLADLRGSGSIEQDADLVIFLRRAEYHLGIEEQQELANKPVAKLDCFVSKNRINGGIGLVQLEWNRYTTRVSNMEE